MTSEERYYCREWLNLPRHFSGAYVIGEVEIVESRCEDGAAPREVSATLMIADCNRQVQLDFDICPCDDADDVTNAVHKARLLRDVSQQFCAALEDAIAVVRDAAPAGAPGVTTGGPGPR